MFQVASQVRQKVLDQLDLICGNSLYCDVTDLEAICGDILRKQHVYTNEVVRRRRSVVTRSMMRTVSGDKRQLIDIAFKLVGKYDCFFGNKTFRYSLIVVT